MARTTDYLMNIRRINKLHESMLKDVCETYRLTAIEGNVISFLYNNPGKDTAGDIVELRMLSKGNVSQAVELLIQKGLAQRRQDETDRRKIHLSLLPAARPITEEIETMRKQFHEEIFSGFSEEEYERFDQLSSRMMQNTKRAMERRGTR